MEKPKFWIVLGVVYIVLFAGALLLGLSEADVGLGKDTSTHSPPLVAHSPLSTHQDGTPFYLPLTEKGGDGSANPTATPTSTPETPTPTATPSPTRPATDAIVVDHTSVDDFEQIPDEYLEAAADLNMLFIDRSVGNEIDDGLSCLSYPSDEVAPSRCTNYTHVDPTYSVDPSEVDWSRSGGYPRDNWLYEFWPGTFPVTGECGTWDELVSCFIGVVDPVIAQYDVVSFQFSYLEVGPGSSIADQPGGFFSDNAEENDVYDLEGYEGQHPDKIVIYWTTSLARSAGTPESEAFNNQMRQYALANDKYLFDVADIQSHDPDGNPCYDNRDGVPYNNGSTSENYPDDGLDIPAICQHYTQEVDGGHFGRVSAGKIRVAKAFWVLMARIAGWDGSTN